MDKKGVVNIYTMELEGIMLSKISLTVIDNYPIISHISGICKTKQVNKHNRVTDTDNQQVIARGERNGRRKEIGVGD